MVGSSKKSPTKNTEHKKLLKLKQIKSFSCLKIVAYVTMMNAISSFLFFTVQIMCNSVMLVAVKSTVYCLL